MILNTASQLNFGAASVSLCESCVVKLFKDTKIRIILTLLKEIKNCTILVKSKKIRNFLVKMPRLKEKIHTSFLVNRSSNWTRHSNGSRFLFLVFWSLLTQCHEAQGYSRITFCYDTKNYESNTKGIAHLMGRAFHLKKCSSNLFIYPLSQW